MEREILFRGKRMDTGEWVEGSPLVWPDGDVEICVPDAHISAMNLHFVDPATVGPYTGLTDKDGQRIFEGDIIRGQGGGGRKDCFVVRWSAACCGFTAGEGKKMFPNLNPATVSGYEVVGNIYDNNLEGLQNDGTGDH